jgi:hypothetical protein
MASALMTTPRIRRRLASASAVAVLASLLVVGPAAAHACATHPVNVRLSGFANGPQDVPYYYWGVEDDGNVGIEFNAFGHDCSGEDTSLKWSTVDGTAEAPGDFTAVSGKQENLGAINDTEETFKEAFVDLNADSATEDAVESFKVKIDSSPHGTLAHGWPIEAPVHVVDDEGTARAGFAAGPSTTIKETDGHFANNPDIQIPVFRAGSSTSTSVVVSYSITPSADDGFTDLTNGSVTIPIGQRHATIQLAVNRDDDGADENLNIQLDAAANAILAENTSTTVVVDDNYFPGSDTSPPETSFHHPKHNQTLKYKSPKARSIHVFVPKDPSAILSAQTALRRIKKGGACQWWDGNGWSPDSCSDAARLDHWLSTKKILTLSNKFIYEHILKEHLKPSMGTKIKKYVVYSRAQDGSGNMESVVELGRNKNKFEIEKS